MKIKTDSQATTFDALNTGELFVRNVTDWPHGVCMKALINGVRGFVYIVDGIQGYGGACGVAEKNPNAGMDFQVHRVEQMNEVELRLVR